MQSIVPDMIYHVWQILSSRSLSNYLDVWCSRMTIRKSFWSASSILSFAQRRSYNMWDTKFNFLYPIDRNYDSFNYNVALFWVWPWIWVWPWPCLCLDVRLPAKVQSRIWMQANTQNLLRKGIQRMWRWLRTHVKSFVQMQSLRSRCHFA